MSTPFATPLELIEADAQRLQNRIGLDIFDDLEALHTLQQTLDSLIGLEVRRLRVAGQSWTRIADTFGMSSSGAQAKWREYAPRVRNRQPKSAYKWIPEDGPKE